MKIDKNSKNVVFLISPLRAGSVLLQSYLDNHCEIMMVPNVFFFFNFIESEFIKTDSLKKNLNKFCDFEKHQALFDSQICYILGRGLGKNYQDSIKINIEKFKNDVINFMKNTEFNFYNFYNAIHHSFHGNIYQKNENYNAKIIFHHIHNLDILPIAKKYFPNSKVITMVREPIKSFESAIRFNLLRSNPKYTNPYNWTLDRYLNGWASISNNSNNKNWKIIKLEKLRSNPKETLTELINWIDLNYDNHLIESTLGGKLWWGDIFSSKPVNGKTLSEPSKITGKVSKNELKILKSVGLIKFKTKTSKINIFLSLIPQKNDLREIYSNFKIMFNLSPSKILIEDIDWDGFKTDKSKKRALFDILIFPYKLIQRFFIWLNAYDKINPFAINLFYKDEK